MRRNLRRVVPRQGKKQVRLREIQIARNRDEMADEFDVVALQQLREQLGRQVAVAILDLVKVLHPVGLTGLRARPLGLEVQLGLVPKRGAGSITGAIAGAIALLAPLTAAASSSAAGSAPTTLPASAISAPFPSSTAAAANRGDKPLAREKLDGAITCSG